MANKIVVLTSAKSGIKIKANPSIEIKEVSEGKFERKEK